MKLITFKITTDSSLLDEQNHITPYVSNLLTKIYTDLPKRKKSTLQSILKYMAQFPKVPTFKNYLSAYYAFSEDYEKAKEVNLRLTKEHPNYLFGKINYANTLINEEKYDEVLQVLGASLLLNELYPERHEFHIDEVISYFSTTIKYLFAVDREEEATLRLDIIKDIDGEHPKVLIAEEFQMQYNFKQISKRIEVVPKNLKKEYQVVEQPQFNFPNHIAYLYHYSLDIPESKLNELLVQDKEKLIEDLILVLQDSINRYDYFNSIYNEKGWEDHLFHFPIHAICLLLHLKAEQAIDMLFEVLRQNNDYTQFWFGDMLRDLMLPLLYHLGKNKESKFISFIKEAHIYCFNKSIVAEVFIKRCFFNDSITKSEAIQWHSEILYFLIENHKNKGIVDTEFNGLYIADLVDLQAEELLPQIKKLFDLHVVGYWVCGDYECVAEDIIKKEPNVNLVKEYDSVTEIYTDFRSYFLEDDGDFENPISPPLSQYFQKPIQAEKKIGRNAPCNCGSGKKYKKCCLNK